MHFGAVSIVSVEVADNDDDPDDPGGGLVSWGGVVPWAAGCPAVEVNTGFPCRPTPTSVLVEALFPVLDEDFIEAVADGAVDPNIFVLPKGMPPNPYPITTEQLQCYNTHIFLTKTC